MSTSIVAIHTELGYTEQDAAALKKVKRVWQKLETYRAKASKDDAAALRSYREFLEKSLVAARQVQELEDPAEAWSTYWAQYEQRLVELNVAELESRRGRPHMEWCERWLTSRYRFYEAALARCVEAPTPANFRELTETADKMLRAYVEAFKDH